MPLTARQQATLEKLIDLYRETREPIHYTSIARRLGIRNTAAYEMLKLLEREGYVTSEYVLSGNAGPGRSSVVFAPTSRADAAFRLMTSGLNKNSEWESVKKQILSRLGQDNLTEQALLEELVSRLPNTEEPLVFCAETLTALFLNIEREARQRLQDHRMMLQHLVAGPQAMNLLNLLPGLMLGLSFPTPVHRASEKLIEYSEICQTYLQQLDEVKQRALADFVRQVLDSIFELTGAKKQENPVAVQLSKK
ncbi:MAG TPA: helix-turn-helix domain-containing protein [Anaerolineae bacterium]